jgi:hypothetical protein
MDTISSLKPWSAKMLHYILMAAGIIITLMIWRSQAALVAIDRLLEV